VNKIILCKAEDVNLIKIDEDKTKITDYESASQCLNKFFGMDKTRKPRKPRTKKNAPTLQNDHPVS
jgi:hypothetical protein